MKALQCNGVLSPVMGFIILMSLGFLLGCTSVQTGPMAQNAVPVTGHVFFADSQKGPGTNTINPYYFSEVWMNIGDTVWLQFVDSIQLAWINNGGDPLQVDRVDTNQLRVILQPDTIISSTSKPWSGDITLPPLNYGFKVNELPSDWLPFRPGDTNCDGRVNFLDLAPIFQEIVKRNLGQGATTFSPTVCHSSGDWVEPWGAKWKWGGMINEVLNCVHADCDINGIVNLDDCHIVLANLTPIEMPVFLRDGYSDIQLKAVQEGNPRMIPAIGSNPPRVSIPYVIRLVGGSVDSIFGCVFQRPLVENSCSQIEGLRVSFLDSDLFEDQDVGGHYILRDAINLNQMVGFCGDSSSVVKIAEIAMFRTKNAIDLFIGAKLNDCIVDLLDPTMAISNGTVAISQFVYDGLLFALTPNGVETHYTQCTVDSTRIDPLAICSPKTDVIIRDSLNDTGMELGKMPLVPLSSPDIWTASQSNSIGPGNQQLSIRVINQSCDSVRKVRCKLFWIDNVNISWPGIHPIKEVGENCYFPELSPQGYHACTAMYELPRRSEVFGDKITIIAVAEAQGEEIDFAPFTFLPTHQVISMSNNIAAREFSFGNK